MVGLGRLELPTSRLSSARSNQLSYKPEARHRGTGSRGQGPDPRPNVRKERETKTAKFRQGGFVRLEPLCSNEEPRSTEALEGSTLERR